MTDKPILFSAPMVRAILDGRKTQTRRIIKRPEKYENIRECAFCAPFQVGTRLWVRETWCKYGNGYIYRADYPTQFTPISDGIGGPWKSPIHMPRKASRITLEVTDVRVQRVQDISEEDAIAEGATPVNVRVDAIDFPHRAGFAKLWDEIHGPGAWYRNDWVWAYTFRRVNK